MVIIEFNPSIPNHLSYINPRNEDVFHGTSALAMVELGYRKGYELAAVTAFNCIFVKSKEFEKLGILDNSLNALRNDEFFSDGRFYQTFDGEFPTYGTRRLVWKDYQEESMAGIVKE